MYFWHIKYIICGEYGPEYPKLLPPIHLMGFLMGSMVPFRQARTPIQKRLAFGRNLGIFRPCYGVTQMVTHEIIFFKDY